MNRYLGALLAIIILFGCAAQKEKKEYVVGINVGDLAPEIAFPSPKGDTIKLSSIRGSVVLIDFWASWCRPCRWENRNLVQTVKHFKDADFPSGTNWYGKQKSSKGFKVFSVSLDQNKAGWEKAILQDKLDWPWHVSDLKGWRSQPARAYKVSSIPTNFLIDAKGVIIGKNLRGKALDNVLEKYRIKTKEDQK